jgi:hypothetical protein
MPGLALRLAFTAILLAAPACAALGGDAPDGGGRPPGTPTAPAAADLSGTWRLTSTFEPGIELLVPETYAGAIDALTRLGENPAEALLDLAEMAGVPAVGTLRDALPGVLEDRLESWINQRLASVLVDGVSVTEHLAEIAAVAAALRTEVALETTLEIGAVDAAGTASARHWLDAVVFAAVTDQPVVVPALVSEPLSDEVAVALRGGAGPRLALGEHAFGLPLSGYLVAAVDQVAAERYGTDDLRGALGALVDCPALASAIASKCILGQCIGHEAELIAICEGALDEATRQIQERLHRLDASAVHFLSGDGALESDRITGTWDATLNAGQGERATPARFTGQRVAR